MWVKNILDSSVGKKLLMAVTGLFFCFFLVVHLIGNLMIYGGKDAFNSYAEHLHSLGPVLNVAEVLMLFFAAVHILTGVRLFIHNKTARPIRYQLDKSGGGSSIGSKSMPYTGLAILIFVVLHLMKFHFGDHGTMTIYDVVKIAFAEPFVMGFYVTAMLILAVHVSHGVWSAFQTFGLNHKKYNSGIKAASLIFSVVVGAGFGFIPVWISFLCKN